MMSLFHFYHKQGFWYFTRSQSHEIQVNRQNPAKFTKTQKIPRNSVEILSNICLYNIFETYFGYRGYLLAVNLQIYLGTSSKSNWWPLLEKRYKRWSDQCKTDRFLAKFALKITTKLAVFYWLLFGEVCPANFSKIPMKSADFSVNLSLKICEIWLFLPRPIRSLHKGAFTKFFYRVEGDGRIWWPPLHKNCPNINIQILQTSLHTFLLRISWENLK